MRPPLRRIPRSVVLAVLVAGIVVGLALVWEGRRGRPSDPRSQGRRASVWFDELVRTAGALGNDDQHLRHLEARIALLQLGATLETVERLARAETAGSALEKRLRPDP